MGDGINDAAAMKAADIGISVDTAVDVAKESADIVLLEKDLMVLEQGIIEGRKTYANMIFDFTTYIFMYFVFCPLFVSGGVLFHHLPAHFSGAQLAAVQARYIGMFQAGWFVESMWSQTLVIHMIRTPKLPFIRSHASASLTLLTLTGSVVLTVIPFTPLGTALGFVALPAAYFAYLIPCILLYMALATSLKKAYMRHYGELL